MFARMLRMRRAGARIARRKLFIFGPFFPFSFFRFFPSSYYFANRIFTGDCVAARIAPRGHEIGRIADTGRAGFAGIDVTTIPPARTIRQVPEMHPIGCVVHVDSVAKPVVWEFVERGNQDAAHSDAQRDIHDIVIETAPIRVTRRVSPDQTEQGGVCERCCGNASVESQQICDGP